MTFGQTPLAQGLINQQHKRPLKESHTNDEAHIVGLIDKEGHHWMHRTDLSRNSKHPEHTSKYPDTYKDASPSYIKSSNKVRSAWHNKTTNQVHEGSPSTTYGGGPLSGLILSPHLGSRKFEPLAHYDVDKEEKK